MVDRSDHGGSRIRRPRGIGAIIITGSEKAFAAGANIKEMADEVSVADVFGGTTSPRRAASRWCARPPSRQWPDTCCTAAASQP
jgi:enoyl-CoA hydratase/carnithine racemase